MARLYAKIETRQKRDFWFCMALIEDLTYLPQHAELINEVGRRALFCYFECTKKKQHSFLSILRKRLRESQRSSFLSERQVSCLLLEGEPVLQAEMASLRDSDTPGDLRLSIARRVIRLGQTEHFNDTINYFVNLSRLDDQRKIESSELNEAMQLMGEMRDYHFSAWLPIAYAAYAENFYDGPVKGRMLSILSSSGDHLVNHLVELHRDCHHESRRPIWRLLHQMVRSGSILAYRAMADLTLNALPQDQTHLCKETRQAISDYITKTPEERISAEIIEMTRELHDQLTDNPSLPLKNLGTELKELLDWDEHQLHEMLEHLLADSSSPEERNRLCRGGYITLNSLIEVIGDPTRSLEEKIIAARFIPKITASRGHKTLGASLWNFFIEEDESRLRVALLEGLAKARWKASPEERRKFEEIYNFADDTLKLEINRLWSALFPGSQPEENTAISPKN